MDICIIGAGYVGLATAALLTEIGHVIYCIDKDINKIKYLNNGKTPIHEPGLEKLLNKSRQSGRLFFSEDRESCIQNTPILIVAVGTPSQKNGDTDLEAIKSVYKEISLNLKTHKTIITKSTVPPGTNEYLQQFLISSGVDHKLFDIVSNPEFLREGSAVYDSLHPDKIVIGSNSPRAIKISKKIYEKINAPFIETSLTGAELMKYASNAFLATKISFINEFSLICDKYDVDITDVAASLGLDARIGPYFLQPGLGYGGSCLPKDLNALAHAAKRKQISINLLNAVKKVNEQQVDYYIDKLEQELNGLKGKQTTVWGLSFKPETDDLRESQSIKLCQKLIEKGCKVIGYDPKAKINNLLLKIEEADNMYNATINSDALVVATDWEVFRLANWSRVKMNMKGRTIFDGRNFLEPTTINNAGLNYLGVGRS
jgi:UDPglucose 6-dehydrogenase